MRLAGYVWCLWAERPTKVTEEKGDFGLIVGIYADEPAARDGAERYWRSNTRANLQLTREAVEA